eukprot:TRINITY_DN17979_c0_g3_i1.p1 TRINITY_DN17979_c0_g3~~TRINITY_DN17979_c0_g3_i1.p1  ORF type:complete len:586 (+),score=97.35 TRINITY_DN17979_c0_g3_i1:57-1760(+)
MYADTVGKSSCTHCPFNSVNNKNGSISLFDCVCPAGMYGKPWNNSPCQECPPSPGVSCKSNNSVPAGQAGFFRSGVDVAIIHECIPQSACQTIGQNLVNNCSTGYSGNRCGICLEGYYRIAGACGACPNAKLTSFFFVCIFFLLIAWLTVKIYTPDSPSRFDIKVVVLWIQTVAVFSRLSTNWPRPVQNLLNLMSAFNFNIDLFAPGCAARFDYWTVYGLQLMVPSTLAVILALIAWIVLKVKGKRHPDFLNHLQRRTFAHPFEKALAIYIFLLASMYTYFVSVAFSPLRCFPQADGTYTLIPNPSQDCYGPEWNRFLPLIVLGIMQICLIPPALLWIVMNYRKYKRNNVFLWRYGLLFKAYTEDFYWWELAIFVRKLVFVALVDSTNGINLKLRMFSILFLLITMFLIEGTLRPFRHKGLGVLSSTLWQIFAMFMLLSSALIFDSSITSSSIQATAVTYILLLWFSICCLLSVLNLVFSLRSAKLTGGDKLDLATLEIQTTSTTPADTAGMTFTLSWNPLSPRSKVVEPLSAGAIIEEEIQFPPPPPPGGEAIEVIPNQTVVEHKS